MKPIYILFFIILLIVGVIIHSFKTEIKLYILEKKNKELRKEALKKAKIIRLQRQNKELEKLIKILTEELLINSPDEELLEEVINYGKSNK